MSLIDLKILTISGIVEQAISMLKIFGNWIQWRAVMVVDWQVT